MKRAKKTAKKVALISTATVAVSAASFIVGLKFGSYDKGYNDGYSDGYCDGIDFNIAEELCAENDTTKKSKKKAKEDNK